MWFHQKNQYGLGIGFILDKNKANFSNGSGYLVVLF